MKKMMKLLTLALCFDFAASSNRNWLIDEYIDQKPKLRVVAT